MLVIGVIGAVAAAFLGWFAGGFYLIDRNSILMAHRWLGPAIAVAGLLLLYLSATARRAPERPPRPSWAPLGVMTFAIALKGSLGGTFMHGGGDPSAVYVWGFCMHSGTAVGPTSMVKSLAG